MAKGSMHLVSQERTLGYKTNQGEQKNGCGRWEAISKRGGGGFFRMRKVGEELAELEAGWWGLGETEGLGEAGEGWGDLRRLGELGENGGVAGEGGPGGRVWDLGGTGKEGQYADCYRRAGLRVGVWGALTRDPGSAEQAV